MKALKLYLIASTFLVLTGLCFKAQGQEKAKYALITKGRASPFDSAVAVEINTYRTETKTIRLLEELNKNHLQKISILEFEVYSLNTILENEQKTIDLLNREIERKNENIQELREKIINYAQETEKKRKFYNRPEFWGGLGLIIGVLISR